MTQGRVCEQCGEATPNARTEGKLLCNACRSKERAQRSGSRPPGADTGPSGKKVLAGVVGVLVLLLVVAAVVSNRGSESDARPQPTLSAAGLVSLDVDGSLRGTRLSVTVQANVPDGAVIAYEVADPLSGQILAEGTTTVRSDRASVVSTLRQAPDSVEVWVGFGVGEGLDQPENVDRVYGEDGAELLGPNRISVGGFTQVSTVAVIDAR